MEAPEKIWASGRKVGSWNDQCVDAEVETEYTRSDIAERQIAELWAELAREQESHEATQSAAHVWIKRAEAAEAREARVSEALREIIEKADYGTGAGLTADSVCEQIGTIARAALSGSGAGGWGTMDNPVPTHECKLRVGQPVKMANPYAEDDPNSIFYVIGIEWEYRMVPGRGWNITIASKDEIGKQYGATDGFIPSDLLPAAPTATGGR